MEVGGSSMLEIRDLYFRYEGRRKGEILSGASLAVEEGSCLCLMGMNGCGKSTLIDCLLGENKPSSGSIALSGEDALRMSPARKAKLMAYVPQVHERTFPYEVEHIVMMGRTAHAGSLWKPGGTEDRRRVAEALESCGIPHLARRPYTDLSGGEMQMVMLARALVQDAPLVVMDEPTAHLDFRNEMLFLETVERLALRQGTTVLMATHSPNQAFHLASAGVPTRVALMHQGRIHALGSPREVLTEQALQQVFGVYGCLLEYDTPQGSPEHRALAGRPVRQLVPLRTIRAEARGEARPEGDR